MKILLTGASSYVGARLYFDISKFHDVLGTYSLHQLSSRLVHLDITNSNEMEKIINSYSPDIILHVAQNPDPRWCEAHPSEAKKLNLEATKNLVTLANSVHSRMVYISSFAAINPKNVYAKTKYESELLTKSVDAGFLIIRPSFILGYSPNTSNDRPFNRLLKNLDQGTLAEYDTSWKFQPTYVGHISQVILTCINKNIWGETIHVTVPDLKTRYETACDILNPFNITVTPVDKHDTTNVIPYDLHELSDLHLPQYTYQRMINTIIEEIRNRNQFII